MAVTPPARRDDVIGAGAAPGLERRPAGSGTVARGSKRITSIDIVAGSSWWPWRWTTSGITSRTSAALFATRWITHFCAPTFFLLAGIGAGLIHQRRDTAYVSRYLATRGLWLLFLELVITAVVPALIQGGELRRIPVVTDPGSIPDWHGLPLPGVYLVWALVVVLLYYPCLRFARLKETRTDWWLRYM